ncbi:odorant receptor 30a [Leptinotarsa decemlineata]|uniref:odorant receptor 30a n=1 Tax=Leptinotarsa decemlineata TaxID=7539 RepID=UPI003D308B45
MESNHFKFIKYLMLFSGTWRLKLESGSRIRQVCYNVYSSCIQGYFCLFVVSLFMQLPVVWKESKAKTFENLSISIFCMIMLMKSIMSQSERITTLLKDMLEAERAIIATSNEVDKRIYYDQVEYTNRINLSLTLYTYGLVGIPLIMLNYISYLQFEKTHILTNTTESKPLPYVSWFPFDSDEYYFVAFGMDSVAAFMGSTYNCLVQLFFIAIMTFVIGRLRILQEHFRNFDEIDEFGENIGGESGTDRNEDHDVLKNLKRLILEHMEIIGCVKKLDDSTKYLLLLEFLMNSFQIASLLVQLLTMERSILILFTLSYLLMVTYQIFLLAWHGNEIKEQSLELSNALYESRWYEHSVAVKKCIHLMMLRSQRPLTLQIGPFYPMTMSTALSTVKAGYSYVTILRK